MEIVLKKNIWILLFPSKQGTPTVVGSDTPEPYISTRGPSSELAFVYSLVSRGHWDVYARAGLSPDERLQCHLCPSCSSVFALLP